MVDNVAITPGSGASIAADDVGGVLYQRIKPAYGADGAATDVTANTGLPVGNSRTEVTGSAGALNADAVNLDVTGWSQFSFVVTGTFSGTLTWQASSDNTNWVAITNSIYSHTQSVFMTAGITTAPLLGFGPIMYRYLRCRMTAYTSGTASVTLQLANFPAMPIVNVDKLGQITNSVGVSMTGLTPVIGTFLTTGARTTTQTGTDITSGGQKGLRVLTNITSAGTGSITITIQCKDDTSSSYFDLINSGALTANGLYSLMVYPGIDAVANVAANTTGARSYRIVSTHNNANSMTYSVGYTLLP